MNVVWKNVTIADSAKKIVVEGNHYFPPNSVRREFLKKSEKHSSCIWKGVASYYHVKVNDQYIKDTAWHYPDPKGKAGDIKDYIVFDKEIEVKN